MSKLCDECGAKLVKHIFTRPLSQMDGANNTEWLSGICDGCGKRAAVAHYLDLHLLKARAHPIRDLLCKILGCSPKPHFQLSIGLVTAKPKTKTKENSMIKVQITNEQKFKISLAPVDGAGKPAPVDGKPGWAIAGNSTLLVADDGLSAEVTSSDLPEVATVTVSADADLGAGVVPIQEVIEVTVVAAQAENLGVTTGTPENK